MILIIDQGIFVPETLLMDTMFPVYFLLLLFVFLTIYCLVRLVENLLTLRRLKG